VNLGTYRVVVHDRNRLGIYISPGKDARIQMEKAFQAGRPLDVAISFGHDPALFVAASSKVAWGTSEYDYAGGLKGSPIQVIRGPVTGLPIPADSEIVVEGTVMPGDMLTEGPFGEFTGYYASGARPAPVVHVKSLLHRNDPIILGSSPGRPPASLHLYLMSSATLWDAMEKAGVPEVCGVWQHLMAPVWAFTAVSIKQRYPGHSRQAGLIASQARGGAYMGRYVVVVDEDIDPSNIEEVIWAMTSRSDPEHDIEIVRKCWSGPLDPIIPADRRGYNSRAIIDACRPYDWRDQFPKVVGVSAETRERMMEKWHDEIFE
jgi:UbiD family decarboxylase